MSLSKSRDVEDLIAEFVSSKNQVLHEEIISSIKRESFGHLEDQQEVENQESRKEDMSAGVPEPSMANGHRDPLFQEEVLQEILVRPTEGQLESERSVEEKISELTHQNALLREELAKVNNQLALGSLVQKAMSADDLRMEFLNFTSAHIQQFNHRIKKTEELIEALSHKSQTLPEKKSTNTFPIWLQWINLIALALIASYFLFNFFSEANEEAVADVRNSLPGKSETIATPILKPAEPKAVLQKEVPVAKVVSATKPATTPFQTTADADPTPFQKAAPRDVQSNTAKQNATKSNAIFNGATQSKSRAASSGTMPFTRNPTKTQPITKPVPPKVANAVPVVNKSSPQKVLATKATATVPAVIVNRTVSKSKAIPTKEVKQGNSPSQQLSSTQQPNMKRATTNLPKPTVQNTASIVNAKPATEKKVVSKEKVYFGED